MNLQQPPSKGWILFAFAAIYLIWGSTYLGIKIAIETLPPLFMGGSRFVIAGALLFGALRMQGQPVPAAKHWFNGFVVGVLLIGFGNGGLTWAEQTTPSGFASLLIATIPMWIATLDAVRPGGRFPGVLSALGIALGFCGILLLVGNPFDMGEGLADPLGAFVLLFAALCWAVGSLFARYTEKPDSPLMGIALQMVLGGAALAVAGAASGEWKEHPAAEWSQRSLLAYAYLVFVGSLVGFTAYGWLLKVCRPQAVSTYAYVNPVIAVFLGWWIGGEELNFRMLTGAAVIVGSVILISHPAARQSQ